MRNITATELRIRDKEYRRIHALKLQASAEKIIAPFIDKLYKATLGPSTPTRKRKDDGC